MGPGFKPRLTVFWTEVAVDFLGRSAAERHVGAMGVVPRAQFREFSLESLAPQWHQRQPCDALLERQDQSLDHGDGAVLADRTEPGMDALPPAPRPECVTEELGASVSSCASSAVLMRSSSRNKTVSRRTRRNLVLR